MTDWPSENERRSETRRHLLYATTARGQDGDSQPVLVRDISARGLLLEAEEGVRLDPIVAVTLPEAGDVEAQVIWQGDKLAGCRLDSHLSQATIDAVRAKGEAAHAEQPEQFDAPVPRTAARSLAARLKQLRLARDLTRAELAERSGISTPSIWAGNRRTVPRLVSLETWPRVSVSVSELQSAPAPPIEYTALSGGRGGGICVLHPDRAVSASKTQIAALPGPTPDRVTITIAL